jgi:uroporphyrin-III C-methyltransferase/precorrin-2 dehydrogenase/sirohydrochlorin ferrochelatase
MNTLPLFFRLSNRRALVVGGGDAAVAKTRLLGSAGAEVTVVAPRVADEIGSRAEDGGLCWLPREFSSDDAAGAALVIAATGIVSVDERVAAVAKRTGVPFNAVDRPDISDFIFPAIVDRAPVTIGISTNGASPVLARRLRERIETVLPTNLGRLARFLESFRGAVAARFTSFDARRRFWEEVVDGDIARDVLAGEEARARLAMVSRINRPSGGAGLAHGSSGHVDIVGAGPGDPELLTVKALRAIQDADVVVHDRLVGEGILDLVRRDARRIYVGKAKSDHALPQDRINDLLVEEARAGRRVVRLKGGDPFVFGRGGEELEALRAAGVSASVVPGITAATGCAAAAGLPLTHRDHASAVTFVTGHGVDGEPDVDWRALAQPRHTVVIYMGLSRAGALAERLIGAGRSPATPVAIIENGTRPDQRVVTGTLADTEKLVSVFELGAPTLIVVGEVAALADAARDVALNAAAEAV